MTKLSRRKFFKRASVGAATIGTLAILPATALASKPEQTGDGSDNEEKLTTFANLNQHLIVHVDPQSRQMVLMYGDQEKALNSPEIASRLLQALRQA
jgi:hypothetical protein